MSNKPTDNGEDFILGTKAADLWLYTCDLCANDKIIPKKYRYTTGTSLMNDVETICELIEGANLLDLRREQEARGGSKTRGVRFGCWRSWGGRSSACWKASSIRG